MAAARQRIFPSVVGSILALFMLAPKAGATTIQLSLFSSEADPAPALLDATLVFMLTGPSQLTLTVSNDTVAPDEYLINGIWWNAAAHVTALGLVDATHSVSGDVTSAWAPVESDTHADGFGSFDFALTGGVGAKNRNLLGPGESLAFVLTISGTGPYDVADFDAANDHDLNAAAKFVSGPGDLSAFGATGGGGVVPVPEPASAALLATGLLGMALPGRRRSANSPTLESAC
jgi:hypothetical protein